MSLTHFAVTIALLLLWRALSELHGRWRRSRQSELSIDALFDAVASGHIDAEDAAEEIVRRRRGSLLTPEDVETLVEVLQDAIERTALKKTLPEEVRRAKIDELSEIQLRLEESDHPLDSRRD